MLENIIGALVISMVAIYDWSKMLAKKVDFKDYRLYTGFAAMTILIIVNFFIVNPIIKILLVIIILALSVMYIFKISFRSALIAAFIHEFIYIVSEIAVVIVVLIVTNIQNNKVLVDAFFGTIYANIIISLVALVVMQLLYVKKIYDKIDTLTKSYKIYNTITIIFTIIAIASLFFYLIYYNENLILSCCLGLIILVICLVFIIKTIIMRNNYLNMYVKYNSTLEMLNSYEDILDKYKVSNHENKNQLLTIRHMLGKENKNDVSKYIDKIVKNEYKDDENLNMETSKIPSGGLRALIYSKLLYMKNNGINFDLEVDRKIRGIQLANLEQNMILDICKIIGVFLDNAIDAVKNIKNGSISIELYLLDEKLNISIGNTFEGFIDLDRIDEMKYTTKGEGHGYGLSLVKGIIDKNQKLENFRMINDNVFIQILKIEI